jgi:hypothetical protein
MGSDFSINTDLINEGASLLRHERIRQMGLWGDQSHNHPYEWMSILGEEFGELCEAVNETCAHNPRHPERGGIEAIRREATQVMAVACAIVEATYAAESDPEVGALYGMKEGRDGD